MQVDQNSNTQQQNKPNNNDEQIQKQPNQRVSEEESSRFSKELKKKESVKSSEEKEESSLESLLAEQRKLEKELFKRRGENGEEGRGGGQHQGSQQHGEMTLSKMQELQLQSDVKLQEIQHTKSIKEVEAALLKMADRIQVSARDAIDGAEMRISMKDSALFQGTEIRVHRHAGELTVTMNTTSAETHNLLAQHQASLQKHLDDRFTGENVQINFNMTEDNNGDEDGRSKNEYASEDSTDDDDNEPV